MTAMTARQIEALVAHEISGVVDAVVTASRDADGALAFHLVVGPTDRPGECDRIEFVLDPDHARTLLDAPPHAPALVPCRVGVEFNQAPAPRAARHPSGGPRQPRTIRASQGVRATPTRSR
ncbi:hypothetical protein AB0P12_25950 [Streptomyces subrutilus]|uniref:hypothetical protein n=1 Tax=Streptomyces subrutilus TaxID=36818 RepID=UPI0033D06F45